MTKVFVCCVMENAPVPLRVFGYNLWVRFFIPSFQRFLKEHRLAHSFKVIIFGLLNVRQLYSMVNKYFLCLHMGK